MSIKTLSKKMLAIVAAGAMTMGLAMPTSVFAAERDTTAKVTEAYISKTFNTEVGKNETFSFKAEQVGGNTEKVTIPDIHFTDSETGTTTKTAKVSFPDWTDAGKYEYTVTETAATPTITDGEHQKMIMSKAAYTMDVYVSNADNGFEISNIIVNKKQDDKGGTAEGKVDISNTDKNGFNFTNTYVQEAGTGTDPSNPGTEPDDDYTKYGSLNVSKKIDAPEGNIDSNATFNFTAKFEFPTGTDANTLGAKAGNKTLTLDGNGQHTFTLKHNESMKYTGLPVGTKITVTETGVANYKGSASVVLNGGDAKNVTVAKYYDNLVAVNGDKLGQKKNTVDVTNTYNYVPTTGIIMNNLPYVLMIALCGAALMAFVAFKRRSLQK